MELWFPDGNEGFRKIPQPTSLPLEKGTDLRTVLDALAKQHGTDQLFFVVFSEDEERFLLDHVRAAVKMFRSPDVAEQVLLDLIQCFVKHGEYSTYQLQFMPEEEFGNSPMRLAFWFNHKGALTGMS